MATKIGKYCQSLIQSKAIKEFDKTRSPGFQD